MRCPCAVWAGRSRGYIGCAATPASADTAAVGARFRSVPPGDHRVQTGAGRQTLQAAGRCSVSDRQRRQGPGRAHPRPVGQEAPERHGLLLGAGHHQGPQGQAPQGPLIFLCPSFLPLCLICFFGGGSPLSLSLPLYPGSNPRQFLRDVNQSCAAGRALPDARSTYHAHRVRCCGVTLQGKEKIKKLLETLMYGASVVWMVWMALARCYAALCTPCDVLLLAVKFTAC